MSQQHKLGTHATTVRTEGPRTYVRYHETDVVRFDDTHVTLDTGGWRTVTTKRRMNQAASQFDLGYQVYQSAGTWYVVLPDGCTVPFDGQLMTFRRNPKAARR